MCYLIPLHARYIGWVKDFGLAACSVVCFASVVMAWYGVNFVLGAGLHSCGFGSGDHTAVYLVGLLNLSLVVHGGMRYLRGRATQAHSAAVLAHPPAPPLSSHAARGPEPLAHLSGGGDRGP